MMAREAARRRSESCRIVEHIVFLDHDFYQTECGEVVKPDAETCSRCGRGFGPVFVRNVAGDFTAPEWHGYPTREADTDEESVCSCCGWGFTFRPGEAWTTAPFRYCPGCGAPIEKRNNQ